MTVQVVKVIQTGHQRQINIKEIDKKIEEQKFEEEKKDQEKIEEIAEDKIFMKDAGVKPELDEKDSEGQKAENSDMNEKDKLEDIVVKANEEILSTGLPDQKEIKPENIIVDGDKVIFQEDIRKLEISPEDEDVARSATPDKPPQSMFRHLFPSRQRYTILKDEL